MTAALMDTLVTGTMPELDETETAKVDARVVRAKLLDNRPLTAEEATALYELLLAADQPIDGIEAMEAGYGRFVHRVYARYFVAD